MLIARNIFLAGMAFILFGGCSHSFDSNVLDLSFYQWNLWQEADEIPGEQTTSDGEAVLDVEAPSCGWEEMHRGTGKLVRIPALVEDYFPGESAAGVYWYHCRFTLPEDWEEREITISFNGVGPFTNVFLNQDYVGSQQEEEGEFEIDLTDVIFYTRDNHLTVRIVSSDTGRGGIGGNIKLISKVPSTETLH